MAPTIDRIPAPNVDTFRREYFARERPVIFTGLTDTWPARKWTHESLSQRFGTAQVSVARTADGSLVTDTAKGLSLTTTQLSEFLRGTTGYLMSRLDELPSELRSEVPTLPYVATASWQVSKLWISSTNTTTALHFDLSDNFHIVLRGRKRFTLVVREESPCVYPRGLTSGLPNGAQVDPENPDLAKFPRWNDAHPVIAELSEGDALFIPSRCWHHVRTLEASIAVNTWFASGTKAIAARAADLFKRVRGLSR